MKAIVAAFVLLAGCATTGSQPSHVIGQWGGPHVGIQLAGGLADVRFDCASGTMDEPLYPGPDGNFSIKGTYRTGAPGPVKVGQFFRSQSATYSGTVAGPAAKGEPRTMTLNVTLEDESAIGPFTLTEGAPPQLTRCL